jgi:ABC-type polysaccharide/polyol phosphate export permease
VYTDCALLAVFLMLVGAFVALVGHRVEEARYCALVCIISLMYSVGIIYSEAFLRVKTEEDAVRVVLVLVPLILSIEYLVRGSAWVSLAGVMLFVFTSSAMIGSNANDTIHGSGFFSCWIH